MLYPTLESLVNIVGNRYLLVNITAKRAREIAEDAIENGQKLEDKPVRLAVQQIYDEGYGEPAAENKGAAAGVVAENE